MRQLVCSLAILVIKALFARLEGQFQCGYRVEVIMFLHQGGSMVVQDDGLTKCFLGEKGVHDARRGMRFLGGFFEVYDRSNFSLFSVLRFLDSGSHYQYVIK
jgi:hypothetical protein